MKKTLLVILFILSGVMVLYAQPDLQEKKLGIKEFPSELLQRVPSTRVGQESCKCENNLFKDGSFQSVTTLPGSSDIATTSPVWIPQYASPQFSRLFGYCDSGFVYMWGNKTVGESISQSGLKLQKGKCYTLRFNARFPNNTGTNNPYVQLAVKGSTTTIYGDPRQGSPADATSQNISSTTWASYSVRFTASANYTSLELYPVNGNLQNNGAYVSWIQLDNVCLEECCDCGEWKGFAYSLKNNGEKEELKGPTGQDGMILPCGKTIVIKSGNTLLLNPLFTCNGGSCTATFQATMTLPNGKSQSISGPFYSFKSLTPGYYIFTVTPSCRGQECRPCRIRVFVTPGCNGDIISDSDNPVLSEAVDGRG